MSGIGDAARRTARGLRPRRSGSDDARTQAKLERTRDKLRNTRRQLDATETRLGAKRRDLRQLAREYVLCRMPKHSVCAELGVDRGHFARRILDVVQPRCLHLIDPWLHEDSERYRDSVYGGLGPEGQAIMDQRYQEVAADVSSEVRAGRVRIHREVSSVAAQRFADGYFDWVYVDANHLYEFVKQDLELYLPKLRVGGCIAGDDYGGGGGWWEHGVRRAVDELVDGRPQLELEVVHGQFIVTRHA